MPSPTWWAALAVAAGIWATVVGTATAARMTDGRFGETTLVGGLRAPTAVAIGPGGRVFVAEQGGRVLTAVGGQPARVLLDISGHVNSGVERGLLGIALDRNYSRNGVLYLLYTYENDPRHPDGPGPMTSRLVRVTITHPADPRPLGTRPRERILLGGAGSAGLCPAASNTADCIPSEGVTHTIGTIRVDPSDGTLWVSNGDGDSGRQANEAPFRAYDETSYAGKIIHVDGAGRGLRRHPFCPGDAVTTHVCTKVFASGFRNPFRFALDPAGGALYAGDVGWYSYEEIDRVVAGGNYGWPCYEGAQPNGAVNHTVVYRDFPACALLYGLESDPFHPRVVQPIFAYPHTSTMAVIGGPRYRGATYPGSLRGRLFFGDFEQRRLFSLGLDGAGRPVGPPRVFATEWDGVAVQQSPDGDLVYADLRGGTVQEIRYAPGRRPPNARPLATPRSGRAPLPVRLVARASASAGRPVYCYWDFGDGFTASGCSLRHTFRSRGDRSVFLRVSDGFKTRDARVRVVVAG